MTAGQWPPPERLDRPAHDSGPGPTATGPSGLGSAAAGPSGPGPRTPRPLQPLQLARALLILFLVRIGLLIMSEFGVEAAVWGRRAMEVRDPLLHRSEEHTSELQSRGHLVCRLLLEKKKKKTYRIE